MLPGEAANEISFYHTNRQTVGNIHPPHPGSLQRGAHPGAIVIGHTWGIPDNALKPQDGRIKSGKYVKTKMS